MYFPRLASVRALPVAARAGRALRQPSPATHFPLCGDVPHGRIGLTLTVVHLFGISVTGTSVHPARSFGPALIVGGTALSQVWLFILAPLVGGVLAALAHKALNEGE